MTAILVAEVFPSARADPVTPADLVGKTICWETSFGPSKSFFGQGGEYSSTAAGLGKGTWAVTYSGVQIDTETRHFVDDMEKRPDGTFVSSTRFGKSTGKVCN